MDILALGMTQGKVIKLAELIILTMGISVNEAGRRGGLAVFRHRGRRFFAEIGRKGQRAMRARYPNMAQKWGKLGGRPKKPKLKEVMGNEGK